MMAAHQMPEPKLLTVQLPDISSTSDGTYTLGVSGVGGQPGSHRISIVSIGPSDQGTNGTAALRRYRSNTML